MVARDVRFITVLTEDSSDPSSHHERRATQHIGAPDEIDVVVQSTIVDMQCRCLSRSVGVASPVRVR